ncbi:SGNH/GDSL hydrolase family protein [Candidatus Sumerlaeota bacterium]|nr:SGNH/GDSL hydrolase family protein [Candidatus Sumerlaeota bacterium]
MRRIAVVVGLTALCWAALSPVFLRLFSPDGALTDHTIAVLRRLRAEISLCLVAPFSLWIALAVWPLRSFSPKTVKRLRLPLFWLMSVFFGLVLLGLIGELFVAWNDSQADHMKAYRLCDNPRLAYEHVPSVETKEKGVLYRINAMGFRGEEWPLDDSCRVMIAGDSVLYGYYVPQEKTFWSIIDQRASEKDGLSGWLHALGVNGYGTYQECELIRVYSPILKPRVVLLAVCLNDADDPYEHINWPGDIALPPEAVPNPELRRQRLAAKEQAGQPVTGMLSLIQRAGRRYSRLYRYVEGRVYMLKHQNTFYNDQLKRLSDPDSPEIHWMGEQFETIQQFCAAHQMELGVVIFPLRCQLTENHPFATQPQIVIKDLCERLGCPALDLTSTLADTGGVRNFVDYCHLSVKGHEVVADKLYSWLLSQFESLKPSSDPAPNPMDQNN